jgi:hypothetical protein
MSPVNSSREAFRSSSRAPSAGASARGTKSTGTNQVRPSLTGGAGSETRRPPTEASPWPGDRTIVCPFDDSVIPPAAVSSRTLSSKSRARSSSANISWPLITRAARGRRPSRDSTVYGAAVGACARDGAATAVMITATTSPATRNRFKIPHDNRLPQHPACFSQAAAA